jgi:outer membrane immunogenic protein
MIRKILVSAAALAAMTGGAWAADLPNVKGPPVFAPPPPVFSWTGLYIGGQVGYQWANDHTEELFTATGVPDGFDQPFNTSGVSGGGHIGYDYQISQFVFGLEGDVNGLDNRGGYTLANGNGTHSSEDVEGAILGRVGIAFDRVLIYATGGGTYAGFHYSYFTPAVTESFSDGRFGWTVGGGIEYAVDPNWSIFADYRYSQYGSFENTSLVAFPGFSYRHTPEENLAQVGFSYKFDLSPPLTPVVAKY